MSKSMIGTVDNRPKACVRHRDTYFPRDYFMDPPSIAHSVLSTERNASHLRIFSNKRRSHPHFVLRKASRKSRIFAVPRFFVNTVESHDGKSACFFRVSAGNMMMMMLTLTSNLRHSCEVCVPKADTYVSIDWTVLA